MKGTAKARLIFLLAATCLVIGGSCARGTLSNPPKGAADTARTLTGTCHAVDLDKRTLEVISGVGLALRAVEFRVDPGCRIEAAGATVQLRHLKAGEVIRIRYREKNARRVAEAIEVLRMEDRPGAQ